MGSPLDYDLGFDGHFAYSRDSTHEFSPGPSTAAPQTPGSVYESLGSQPKLIDPEDPVLKYGTPAPTPGSSFGSYGTDIKSEHSFYFQPELFNTPEKKETIDASVLHHGAPQSDLPHGATRSMNPHYNETDSTAYGFKESDPYANQYGPMPSVPSQPFHFHHAAHHAAHPFPAWQFTSDNNNDQLSMPPGFLLAERANDAMQFVPENHLQASTQHMRSIGGRQATNTRAKRGSATRKGRKASSSRTRVTKRGAKDPDAALTRPFTCGFGTCTGAFQRKEHQKRHWMSIHRISSDQIYTCLSCKKRFFGRRDNYGAHIALHVPTDEERERRGKKGRRRAAYDSRAEGWYAAFIAANSRKRSPGKTVCV